jgi:hypothetical protein
VADLADVEQAIVELAFATLYPLGLNQASIIGSQCRVYRGWPVPAGLNADLAAGVINVTVSPDHEPGKVTTRYSPRWQTASATPTTTVTIQAGAITVGGNPSAGDVIGALVNGSAYAYRVLATDTTDLVAAGLSAGMQGSVSFNLVGSTITLNEPAEVLVRVVRDASATAELRRQEKCIRVICWCPDPTSRDSVAAAIDQRMMETPFLIASDQSSIRVIYRNTSIFDQAQNASLFRRDLVYSTEYATIATQSLPSMLFGDAVIAGISNYG